jgi:hypothetical protein
LFAPVVHYVGNEEDFDIVVQVFFKILKPYKNQTVQYHSLFVNFFPFFLSQSSFLKRLIPFDADFLILLLKNHGVSALLS